MEGSVRGLAALLVSLTFFASCVAQDVEELSENGVTANNLETYLRHHPADLEEGDMVHDFGKGYTMRESHLNHLANHIGNHLKYAANELNSHVEHIQRTGWGSKKWMDEEVQRYHREEGGMYHAGTMKKRAWEYVKTKTHNHAEAMRMWKKGNADDFYEALGTHKPEIMEKDLIYDPEKDSEFQDAVSGWDDWMAKHGAEVETWGVPDKEDPADTDSQDLGESMDINSDRHWSAHDHPAAKTSLAVVTPKQPSPSGKKAAMVQRLRSAGYNQDDLKRIMDVVASTVNSHSQQQLLGESQKSGGTCRADNCADVLKQHILDTNREIALLRTQPITPPKSKVMSGPCAKTMMAVEKAKLELGLAKKSIVKAMQAVKDDPNNSTLAELESSKKKRDDAEETLVAVKNIDCKVQKKDLIAPKKIPGLAPPKDEPIVSIGNSHADDVAAGTNNPKGITKDDIIGEMEGGKSPIDVPLGLRKPPSTAEYPPAGNGPQPGQPDGIKLPPRFVVCQGKAEGDDCEFTRAEKVGGGDVKAKCEGVSDSKFGALACGPKPNAEPEFKPAPAPEEMPDGCPVTEDRNKCKKFKFMGPFACWAMGQGAHAMGNEGLGADFRVITRGDFYPVSGKLGIIDLADFRWRYTAGKCMWWNQMFRSMNEPLWLEDQTTDNTPKPEGGFKALQICLIYSFMSSRHWAVHGEGSTWPIAIVKGLMLEFGSDDKNPVLPESQKLVDALKYLNGDLVGSVWTWLYELGMSPCTSYAIMFGMICEAIIGFPVMATVDTTRPAGCRYQIDTPSGKKAAGCGPDPVCLMTGGSSNDVPMFDATGAFMRMPPNINSLAMIPPLSFLKVPFQMAHKMVSLVDKPVGIFRCLMNTFFTTKAFLSDPLDVVWIHLGDLIALLEIMFMIPIKAVQSLLEALVKGLKLPYIMSLINKALDMVVTVVFKNPITKAIIAGPLKVCSMILKAFADNPVSKGLVNLMKGFMKLLDTPIKLMLGPKRMCFTIMGIINDAAKMIETLINKAMSMVKAVVKPIIKIVETGLKKILSFIKLPNVPGLAGLAGKAGGLIELLKSIGATDNPLSQYMTCAFNLPFVQYSGQNLCNCCMLGWITSNKIDPLWTWSETNLKAALIKKQGVCGQYGFKTCNIIEADKKVGAMDTILSQTCPTLVSGELTLVGKKLAANHMCAMGKARAKAFWVSAIMYVFKGFMCRFQQIGINPKLLMQLSPLPALDLFRRRRAGSSTTPGQDKCKCFIKAKWKYEKDPCKRKKWKKLGCEAGDELGPGGRGAPDNPHKGKSNWKEKLKKEEEEADCSKGAAEGAAEGAAASKGTGAKEKTTQTKKRKGKRRDDA